MLECAGQVSYKLLVLHTYLLIHYVMADLHTEMVPVQGSHFLGNQQCIIDTSCKSIKLKDYF